MSAKEEKHLIHSNRYVSQSISLSCNWPQRSPLQSRVVIFNAARESVLLIQPLSSQQTKLLVPGEM